MLKIERTNAFKKDFKRVLKRGCSEQKLINILKLLVTEQALPVRCKPHRLIGEYSKYWECHIEPNWLLIYEYSDDKIILIRTGTHSDLFI